MDHRKHRPLWKRWRIEPGALYNLGNVIGFGVGLGVALHTPRLTGDREAGPWERCIEFMIGSPAAFAVTLATLVFFWSGLVYSKAWTNGAPPDPSLNMQGDLLSGIGAICLAVGLFMVGEPFLAATAGCLHALGKLGSAIGSSGLLARPGHGSDFYVISKDIVLASRIPALLSSVIGFKGDILSVSFVVCTLIWAGADWKLLTPTSFWKKLWHPARHSKWPL
ncbi:hypothetical protein [Devosia submarina]|uniref:hypothetical protein n=1 Tax=Devosia submarina TaxID=1173082 RepID=UPI0013007FD1|nr:hypothetical protein [Devosia submarina]